MMMAINGRSGGGAGGGSGCRFPFTASQWQELEHQALIFKYMASGHPIPSDLILPIRRSVFLDSASPQASFFPHQPNVGWGCFQMGFGRKAEDPEPGRCRRTDGKKWRCSKEAHPDSKYCERHMHRGKNRSRKPVEMSLNATGGGSGGSASSSSSSSASTTTSSAYAASLYAPPATHVPLSIFAQDGQQHHAAGVYPYSSVSSSAYSRPSAAQFHLDPASPSADRDYRYFHGLKDDVDPFGCFPESNGGGRDASWRFTPLGLGDPKPRGCSFLQQDGGADDDKQQHQQQHCFVLGADLKTEKPSGKGEEEESQRTLRHFFDEWPLKSKESSWIGLEDEEQQQQHRPTSWSSSSSSFSKTQLSISTPMAAHNDLSLQW